MSDTTQLTNEAANLLSDLRAMLEKGGQFVMEQAPPLAKEIIAYGRVVHVLWILIAMAILFSVYKLAPKVRDAWEEMDNIVMGLGGGGYCLIGTVGSLITILLNVEAAVKVWFAPRLYLLDYVMSALHGGCK